MNRATQSALSNPIPCSISKEDLANLPIRRYGGDVRMVATAQDLEHALEDISHENVVGLDTETRPSFRKGESYLPCLVQVATARAVYLFQLSPLSRAQARQGGEQKQMWVYGVRWDAMLVKTDYALVLWARCLSLVLGYVGDTGEPWRRHPA